MTTIIDSNVTTLISTLVLFWLGSGAVRGFAVTLTIGILASMFTAVTLTRLMVSYWLRWARPVLIPI
jgi:preprotein translocase subunit SecD